MTNATKCVFSIILNQCNGIEILVSWSIIQRFLVDSSTLFLWHPSISFSWVIRTRSLGKLQLGPQQLSQVFGRRTRLISNAGREPHSHHRANNKNLYVYFIHWQGLLTADGTPIGLSGLATHLYYQEPANLTFVSLLQEGAFHKLCRKPKTGRSLEKKATVNDSSNMWNHVNGDKKGLKCFEEFTVALFSHIDIVFIDRLTMTLLRVELGENYVTLVQIWRLR